MNLVIIEKNNRGEEMGDLQFKNINKVYPNGFHAVHDFNLDIKDGEFVVFVGPSVVSLPFLEWWQG